jgi:hypothetical protein
MKKFLALGVIASAMIGCELQPVEFKSTEKAQMYDNGKLVYESDCAAFAGFDVNERSIGVLRIRDGKMNTVEVRTFDMADKAHNYVFKKTTCKE